MAAAADTPIIALFISSSFSDPPNGRIVVATDTVSHFDAETDSAERKPPGQHSREAKGAVSPGIADD